MSSFKHFFFSVLLTGAVISPVFSQYSLTVESNDAVIMEGFTVYRLYVDMVDPTDRMSAVFGNDETPLEIETPDGVFNSVYNSSWSASGINEFFLATFPEMAEDTYATIGLEGPAGASELPDVADPSVVDDSAQPISPFFLVDGSTNLLVNTLTGASYYVLNTAANGLPNEDMRVLIMQVVTTGDICGSINFQVFPLGVGANQVQTSIDFCGTGTFAAGSGEIPGCTIEQACNYNPEATINDGTCDFVSCLALGCTDMDACNYDPEALYEDGTCEYAMEPYDCDGDCVNDVNMNGICDEWETPGCIDETACNYDAAATINDDTCFYAQDYYDCEGICLADADSDGVCDPNEVDGCDDMNACNYNAEATDNDGSCDYCSCSDAGTDGYGLVVELVAEHTEGELDGMSTYRVYVTTPNDDDFLSAVYGDDEDPLNIVSTTSFYQHMFGSVLGSDMFPDIYPTFPELEFDSWVTIGLDQGTVAGESAPQVIQSTDFSWVDQFEAGGNLDIDDSVGGSWFVLDPGSTANAYSGSDLMILVAQLTTEGVPSGTIQAQFFNHGSQDDVSRVALSFNGLSGTSSSSCGCTDETACNYDMNATDDDGTCSFPEDFLDCAGNCINDADGDGICDEEEVPGCTDMEACNYDSSATDDNGSCTVNDECGVCGGEGIADGDCDCDGNQLDALGVCGGDCSADLDADEICDDIDDCVGDYDALGVCNGDCVADEDGNGVCDTDEIWGCTDELACNYDSSATQDDGGCVYPEEFYDCDGNCLTDSDGDLICDEFEIPGCEDMEACNYEASATDDDGSCWFADMYYDCDGNCIADEDADGVCDELEIDGCTDMDACNYDADATDEDSSCWYAEMYYDCDGECLVDSDGDGVCDELEIAGCTDMGACNYDELATDDDGSCEFDLCAGCTDEYATNFDPDATLDNGSCCYLIIELVATDALCAGDNGTITATVTGGEETITYTLDGVSNETGVFEVGAGTYTVTATESSANMCSSTSDVTVGEPEELTLEASSTDATSEGGGVGTATASGGSGNIEIYWLDENGVMVDETSLPVGDYEVFAVDGNGCEVTTTVIVIFDSIELLDPLAFGMFPNPTNGDLTIQLPSTFNDVLLQVVDGVGRVIYAQQLNVVQGNVTMSLSHIAAGTYSVMLSNDLGTSVRRLSIVR
jgi:hypothetical protein